MPSFSCSLSHKLGTPPSLGPALAGAATLASPRAAASAKTLTAWHKSLEKARSEGTPPARPQPSSTPHDHHPPPPSHMPADDDAELFAVVDPATGDPTGALVPRSVAHARGDWHRTVHVCVWSDEATPRLLLQRRASSKGVCPGAWDVSAAEHCRPGEGGAAAAVRGLREELGLRVGVERVEGPSPAGLRVSIFDAPPILDRELVETFHVRGWSVGAALDPDPAEVCGVRWVSMGELREEVVQAPGGFTPWGLEQGRWQGWWG